MKTAAKIIGTLGLLICAIAWFAWSMGNWYIPFYRPFEVYYVLFIFSVVCLLRGFVWE